MLIPIFIVNLYTTELNVLLRVFICNITQVGIFGFCLYIHVHVYSVYTADDKTVCLHVFVSLVYYIYEHFGVCVTLERHIVRSNLLYLSFAFAYQRAYIVRLHVVHTSVCRRAVLVLYTITAPQTTKHSAAIIVRFSVCSFFLLQYCQREVGMKTHCCPAVH